MKNKSKNISHVRTTVKSSIKNFSPVIKSLSPDRKKIIKHKSASKGSLTLKKHKGQAISSRISDKYRDILDDLKEAYDEVDLAGYFNFFNDSVCRVPGYSRSELMGMNKRQYADGGELKKVFHAYNKVYKKGKPVRAFNWQITSKDGNFQ